MKKEIFFLFSLLALIFSNSCNDLQPNKIYPELFKQIAGRWELVSESNEYYIDGVLQHSWVKYNYPWGEQDGDTTFLLYLNFKYIGSVSRESEDGFEYITGYRWGVTDNEFWFTSDAGENQCELLQLNDTTFLFSHTCINDNTNIYHGTGIHVEIITFALEK